MAKELIQEYEFKYYPVSVKFIERKRADSKSEGPVYRKNDIELIVVNNGCLKIETSNGVFEAGAGNGLIINDGVEYEISSSPKEDTAFFSVVFSPEFVLTTDENSGLSKKYSYKKEDGSFWGVIKLDEGFLRDEALIDRINDIIAVNTSKRRGYELLTKSYLCMLWAILLDYVASDRPTFNGINVPTQDELRASSMILYMQDNYADPLTLDDLADKIHVSRNECCRCFKRVTLLTPMEYLNRLRVFMVAKALYKDPMSVESISNLAFNSGFNNTSYFNKMFKRFFECTPSEFTKMLKDDPENAKKVFEGLQDTIVGI